MKTNTAQFVFNSAILATLCLPLATRAQGLVCQDLQVKQYEDVTITTVDAVAAGQLWAGQPDAASGEPGYGVGPCRAEHLGPE